MIVNVDSKDVHRIIPIPKPHTRAVVNLKNKEVHFSSLCLEASYGEHHFFEVTVGFDVLKKEFFGVPSERIELIDEILTIEFLSGKDSNFFKGIITGISIVGKEGVSGHYVLKGVGMTVRLEQGKRFEVYTNRPIDLILSNILQRVNNISGYDLKIIENGLGDISKLDYVMQYNESDWEFIQRLCYQYNFNLYYDGLYLIIGDEKSPPKLIPLVYDRDITNISFNAQYIPNIFTHYINDINDGKDVLIDSDTKHIDTGRYERQIFDKQLIFGVNEQERNPVRPSEINGNFIEVQSGVVSKQTRNTGKTVCINGLANTPLVKVGSRITVEMPDGFQVSSIGTYVVTKSIQTIDKEGNFHNEFEAVSAAVKFIPVKERPIPVVSSMEAEVTSTDDPLGMGRVSIRFPFQYYSDKVWVRVLVPDAGATYNKEKNRGFVFIPEVGSKVIVGFERNNPAFPYVMGALFTRQTGGGGGEKNGVKTFRSSEGHTIEFNDTKDGISLSLYDKNANIMRINTKEDKIEISAVKEIVLNSKKITINATEELALIGSKISESAKEHEVLTEGTYKAEANEQKLKSNNYTQSSTGDSKIISGSNLESKGSNIKMDMGGNAQSPKAPKEARNMVAFNPTPQSVLESEILPEETNVEERGENPQVVSIKLLDDEGNETEFLSRSTNLEVETKDMANKKLELKLMDDETNDEIHVGDFFIPTNDYIVKANLKKRDRSISEEGCE